MDDGRAAGSGQGDLQGLVRAGGQKQWRGGVEGRVRDSDQVVEKDEVRGREREEGEQKDTAELSW